MSKVLHLDVSPRGARSHSRTLGQEFVSNWSKNHPNSTITYRDLGQNPEPHVTESWVVGAYTPPEEHSHDAKAAIAVSNKLVDELLAADHLLITTPMYNLSIPSALKAWIDQIVRAGRTFKTSDKGYEGLVHGKKAVIVVASGGNFTPDSPAAGYNFIEPYMRAILGFIGITDVQFVYAHSINQGEAAREQA
ncbi:MAG TPA: FMN-dependent NADH-azoreductase, partial [Opitutaceae bacterium]|nr:FMN-dependent NADH-azoreductase [Opitutaceae bacterium]